MANLPVEIWLQIIEDLRPDDDGLPIIGVNAAWTVIYGTPFPGSSESPTTNAVLSALHTSRYADLQSLRLVNKIFNELCIPRIFEEFNLLDPYLPFPSKLPHMHIVHKHAKHIRTMRILLDPALPIEEYQNGTYYDYHRQIAALISQCQGLSSLGVYYRGNKESATDLIDSIARAASRLMAFGIYSLHILHNTSLRHSWNWQCPDLVLSILDDIAEQNKAPLLKYLDIAVETSPVKTFDNIRTGFPSLTSLTIRRALRSAVYLPVRVGQIWDPQHQGKWLGLNLTTLNLIDCTSAYAAHIVELVHHAKALQYLIVSTCGDFDDRKPPPRVRGWSSQDDALCKQHERLRRIHIEHMLSWEIVVLGAIPTGELIASTLEKGHLLTAMQLDPEIFPGLEVVRTQDVSFDSVAMTWSHPNEDAEGNAKLAIVCEERGAKLHLGASPLIHK